MHHRLLLATVLLSILSGAAALTFWFVVLRDPATRVGLAQAVRLYHHSDSARSSSSGGDGEPPAGVYRYRTTGGEHLSFAGIARTFPSTSDMIVTDRACTTMLWEPLEEHTEGLVTCALRGGGVRVAGATSYESIAGTSTTSVIRCPANAYFVPPDPVVGRKWRATCTSGRHEVGFSGSVLGIGGRRIDGIDVAALEVALRWTFEGPQYGTNPNLYWVSRRDGLVLRQDERVDVTQPAGPLGSVRYTERMAIELRSMVPTR